MQQKSLQLLIESWETSKTNCASSAGVRPAFKNAFILKAFFQTRINMCVYECTVWDQKKISCSKENSIFILIFFKS